MSEPVVELVVEMAGTPVGVLLPDDAAVRAEVERQWARCLPADPAAPDPATWLDVATSEGAHTGGALAPWVWERLAQEVTVTGIEARAGTALMLHATAVAAADGRTAVLVAPSGTGKTTAASHLGRSWGYVTDETVVVEPGEAGGGGVRRYPKPLSVCGPGTSKEQIAPDDLGLRRPGPETLRVAAVYLLERRPSADGGGAAVTRPALTEFIAALAPHTSYLASLEHPLRTIAAVLGSADYGVLRYEDVSELDAVVAAVLGDPA